MTSQTDNAVSQLRELLLRDAWVHDVRGDPIAFESLVLIFREKGEVSERVYDDSGWHDTVGMWQLEESDGKVVLVLTGDNLRYKGRFTLRPDVKGDVVELGDVGGETVVRFQHQKGYRSSSWHAQLLIRLIRFQGLSLSAATINDRLSVGVQGASRPRTGLSPPEK